MLSTDGWLNREVTVGGRRHETSYGLLAYANVRKYFSADFIRKKSTVHATQSVLSVFCRPCVLSITYNTPTALNYEEEKCTIYINIYTSKTLKENV